MFMGIGAVFIAGALNDIVFLGAFIARLAFLLACFILVISFYLKKFSEKGLYILDEPEAALSPQRQMSLLCLIDDLVKRGSQFIIATHSPILISYRDGQILDLNNDFKEIKYEDTDIYQTYKMYLKDPYRMQHMMFDD